MNDFKIDYVVTYLDPSDKYWLDQFAKYKESEFKKQPKRYDIDGKRHLKFHFRCIEKYMPWINNVYLVVFSESQVPKWINRDTVKIVTDDMYIPKKFLPTFNTATKQMHLQFIPGLEEHFIFADDDQFTIRNVSMLSYFNQDGKPRCPNRVKRRLYNTQYNGGDSWPNILYNSYQLAYNMTGNKCKHVYGCSHHLPHSVLKSDMLKYYEQNKAYIESTITPCRNYKNVIGVTWYAMNDLLYKDPTDLKVVEIHGGVSHKIAQYQKRGVDILNINYNNQGNSFYTQFSQLFPNISKYELYDDNTSVQSDPTHNFKPIQDQRQFLYG